MKPHEVLHTAAALRELADSLKQLGDDVRVIIEHTGRYWLPVAQVLHESGLFVCAINPKLLSDDGNNTLRRNLKTDKADSKKLSKHGLKYWNELIPYAPTEITRQKLKEFSRQLDASNKLLTGLKNNLQAIVDVTFPGVRKLITSPARNNGHIKWVDFICTFYHCDCVKKMSADKFAERYRSWCKRNGYMFTGKGCAKIYLAAQDQVTSLPCDADTKLLITELARQLTAISAATETWRSKIDELARLLPEYDCVMAMYGCGRTTGPQLMAEIGDVTRFDGKVVDGKKIPGKKTLVQYAGIAPGKNQSGNHDANSVKASKHGSPHLRRTLFQIVSTYLKCSPADEPVYQFLDRKRSEGKHYYVYMTAGANKFLRRYYAQVMEYLAETQSDNINFAEPSV
jgi:transposase